MATAVSTQLDGLPDEILLQILSYLSPYHITQVQLISRQFRKLCLDDGLWKWRCYEESKFSANLAWRRLSTTLAGPVTDVPAEIGGGVDADRTSDDAPPRPDRGRAHDATDIARHQDLRDMANWDPTFPDEQVSWYHEYIQRNGRMSVNWLEQPRIRVGGDRDTIDVRGTALYRPEAGRRGPLLAVSPLDDGSVCLWDLSGSRGRKGAVVAKSATDILFVDGPSAHNTRRSKRIDTGVIECVSVNDQLNRAFFAVQSHLIEVDLTRLDIVDHQSFPWSITALSAAEPGVPLTVGTNGGIHLYDYRTRVSLHGDVTDRVEGAAAQRIRIDPLKIIFDRRPLPAYAPLSQPTALSILHPPRPGRGGVLSDDIYVAGRFSNILHYDRRKFPSILDSIYSGARLSALACLPYPFSAVDSEQRRKALLSVEQVARSKQSSFRGGGGGRTLIACGEYGSKGSLELYGLSYSPPSAVRMDSVQKNRYTAASSKLLSVAAHGTRIVCSDSMGNIKWFERDGSTGVRSLHIGHSEVSHGPSIFASMPGSDDLARKLVPTEPHDATAGINNDDILFWTGDKLGLVTFSRTGFAAADFELQGLEGEAGSDGWSDRVVADLEREEAQKYQERMRQALSRQADEARFMSGLGLGDS